MTKLEEVREKIARFSVATHRYMRKRYLTMDSIDQIFSIEVRPGCTIRDLLEKELTGEIDEEEELAD